MRHLLDLTHLLEEGVVTAPLSWHPPFHSEQLGRVDVEGSMTHKITFGTHVGTHIDSPAHMIANGKPTVENIPLDILIGQAKVFQIPKKSGEMIEEADIRNIAGLIERKDMVLIHTGADVNWNRPEFFNNYPTFSKEAAELLVHEGVSLVGMDTPSPDKTGVPKDDPERNIIHKIFLNAGVYIVEGLENLGKIPCTQVEAIMLPLKIKGADGCPVRAVAIYEE